MSAILVDSNVLLDILTVSSTWEAWSANALAEAATRSRLVINVVIYAEVSVTYDRIELADEALPAGVEREQIPYEAGFLAGKIFRAYRRRGGSRLSPLPVFLIGAHAAVLGHEILTRDPTPYRTYFPGVPLITP
jgi:predicted nucleic acid-binding protein